MKREDILKKTIARLALQFNVPEESITEETDPKNDLQAKSVDISRLANYFQDELEVAVPYMDIAETKNVGELVDLLVDLSDY